MEHKVYVCGWRQTSEGFKLWLKSQPTICGGGPDYPSAESNLLQAIRDNCGAMHAVLEFAPPLPKSEQDSKYLRPELYLICGDDQFQTDAPRGVAFESADAREQRFKWVDEFFTRPVCRTCARATSERNQHPLSLSYAPSRADGAFGYVGAEAGTRIEIVSDSFLGVLTESERSQLKLREVKRKGKGRDFFEVIGPGGLPFVGVSGLSVKGWRCEDCNGGVWGYWLPRLSMNSFVAARALPNPLPTLFTVGVPPEIYVCVTGVRWRELVGKVGVRGFTSRPLGVVPDHEVVVAPELPKRGRSRSDCLRPELSK